MLRVLLLRAAAASPLLSLALLRMLCLPLLLHRLLGGGLADQAGPFPEAEGGATGQVVCRQRMCERSYTLLGKHMGAAAAEATLMGGAAADGISPPRAGLWQSQHRRTPEPSPAPPPQAHLSAKACATWPRCRRRTWKISLTAEAWVA